MVQARLEDRGKKKRDKEMRRQRTHNKNWAARATLILSAAIMLGVSSGEINASQKPNRPPTNQKVRARKLGSVDQLKEAFQNDAGKVRLVALISPT
jgi:hypothetical protein